MPNWRIDGDHSCASFAIRHLGLAYVRGLFAISGMIRFDPETPTQAAVAAEIEVSSVNTGIRKRDEHLLTSDFFDAVRYPLITFKSTGIDFIGPKQCRVTGVLSLHGVSRAITFEGDFTGPRGNPLGEEISIGFSGSTMLNREEFGILWGSEPLEGGGLVAGREVQLFLDVEADKE